MRRGRRVTGERLGVPQVDEALDQSEGVVATLARFEAARDAEGQQRACAAAEVLARLSVRDVVGEAGVVDPLDAWIVAQELGHEAPVLDVPLDAQRDRLDALQQEERAERR